METSKVTVEYRDPSGVFPLVSRDIYALLPLLDLHWQSQNHPTPRQIKSLHLDFVPDSLTRNALHPTPVQRQEVDRNSSIDIFGNGRNRDGGKERRHQIPGLQTSPYLKIYVLRCDDKDTYKSTERAKLREWMKQSTASKKNGNHDSFEWLILHVVIPDTHAASEPRWRETTAEESEDLKERPKQGAKWPGKSKRTVFDKLRADFNESGKGAQDRIAQIRIPRDQTPVEFLPTPAVAGTLRESQEERDKAFNDLIAKIRTLTLSSFDQRVKQYETDIAQQDARRAMPGFNFCTFFIYKEGLAKALESVGLVEDALVIYDELSLGLESAVRDVTSGKVEGLATTFASCTDDIKERITDADDTQTNGINGGDGDHPRPARNYEFVESKYRERIARSNISVFDFFSYLFSRQKALILRLANAQAARLKLGISSKDDTEDLVLISEVCWRAATFIHNNARILRQDLHVYKDEKPWAKLSDADIESLVSSWAYDMAGKILEETSSYTLDHMPETGKRESLANGHTFSPRSDSLALKTPSTLPKRTTSLPPRKSRVAELQGRTSLQSASESDLMSRPSSSEADTERASISIQPGFAELVTYRASLVMLRRKSLELLAKQRGWLAGWAMVKERKARQIEEIDLNGEDDYSAADSDAHTGKKTGPSSLVSSTLTSSLSSKHDFYEAYSNLSEQAMRYYVTSTQTKSAEAIIGDLAILKYQQGDYDYAVSYFQHVLPLYAEDGWSLMEAEGLRIYATCLKDMGRQEDYVQTLLLLLAKVCAKKKEKKVPRMRFEVGDDAAVELEGLLSELLALSESLDSEITTSAELYFADVRCDREIQHFEDRDGFALYMNIRHLLNEEIEFDRVSMRLISVEDPHQEIWMSNKYPVSLTYGTNQLKLESNTVAFGAFLVDKVVLRAKMLQFEYDFGPDSAAEDTANMSFDASTLPKPVKADDQPAVFLYPLQHAFNAEAVSPRHVQLEATRFFDLKLSSGWNDIQSLDLKLKPASAGLRLHLADAHSTDIDYRNEEESASGHIALEGLKRYSSARVQIPYSVEQTGQDILVRLEAWYHTSVDSFVFVTSFRLSTKLPVDVEVHDTFQLDSIFSSFTVRTTSDMPLCIAHANLESSGKYQATGPPVLPAPMMVFEKQPVSLLYKITQTSSEKEFPGKKDNSLALSIHYSLTDEILNETLISAFADALSQSPFADLSRLLIPLLRSRSSSLWPAGDVEMALLFKEAKTPTFEDVGWQDVVPTLPSAVQSSLTQWLKTWHRTQSTLTLSQEMAKSDCLRCLAISVDVPQVDFVHKASLLMPRETKYSKHYPPILVQGQPVTARLKLTSTNRWSDRTSALAGNSNMAKNDTKRKNFVFDVQADSDYWLIGGQRRAHFAFQESVERTFELLLVPLRLGITSLPHLDVKFEQAAGNADGLTPWTEGDSLTSETQYESAGSVVRVIRDSNKARVYIPEPNTSGHVRSRSAVTMIRDAG